MSDSEGSGSVSEGSGAGVEPAARQAAQADSQMRAATERLRDKAWMVAPLTTAALPDATGEQAETVL